MVDTIPVRCGNGIYYCHSLQETEDEKVKKKWSAFVCVLVISLALFGCGKAEETTITGMVVAVDGSVISLL